MSSVAEYVVAEINRLDLRHRKNWHPSEDTYGLQSVEHLLNEAKELLEAVQFYAIAAKWDKRDIDEARLHVKEELGDCYAVLLQIALRVSVTRDEIDVEAARKMILRFDNADKIEMPVEPDIVAARTMRMGCELCGYLGDSTRGYPEVFDASL